MVMKSLISKLMGTSAGLKGMVLASAIGMAPAAAFAGHHDDVRFDLRFGLRPPIIAVTPLLPAPVYQDREVRVWVEPVYRTAIDHVWIADQYEFRDVVHFHHGWRHVYQERVLVAPAHYEDVQRQELVTPGHWETRIERVRVQ
jgi:hypothetical protein